MRLSSLIRRRQEWARAVWGVAVATLLLTPIACTQGNTELLSSGAAPAAASPAVPAMSTPDAGGTDATASRPAIVIGFLGGYVRHDDTVHSEVQLAHRLRSAYPAIAVVETFENRRREEAHSLILRALDTDHNGVTTEQEKRAARVVLYGHSWGANAVVALARELKTDGIPVLLTVQVDSIARDGQDDGVIPSNVAQAVNFYQDKGFLHGQPQIQAADASHTQILGNFRMDYESNPISCPSYPWYDRFFMRSHIEIECDPNVWHRIETLIREQLPTRQARDSGAQ